MNTEPGAVSAVEGGWPADLDGVFEHALTCEYASLTRDLRPVTWAVTPYRGERSLDVSTGLSYPDKAERARRNPQVALLFSDPTGSPSATTPVVLVQGRARVRDADLQANTDRYLRESLAKTSGMDATPWFLRRRMSWYFARIWIEVWPERMLWWPGGDLDSEPQRWEGGPLTVAPSDPAPAGKRLPSRLRPPVDWRPFADRAQRLRTPVLTTVVNGSPLPLRTRGVQRTTDGFRVDLPAGVAAADGPACLTFHRVGPGLEWQENVVLVGRASVCGTSVEVTVERALNDWSLAGSNWQRMRAFTGPGGSLRRRVAHEAARRGQPVPTVRRVTVS